MIQINSHIEAETLLKAILQEGHEEVTFVSEGGNGEEVHMNLSVAFNSDDDLRGLFMKPEIQEELKRLGIKTSYER